jgi:circadian clock protein KaiC
MDKVTILDLTPPPEVFSEVQTHDIFVPAEVEREPISRQITKVIEQLNPRRIFVDGFGHFRNLAPDPFQQSRLAQSFFRFATRSGATLIIGSEDCVGSHDVDGVMHLEFSPPARSVQITKFRGSDFHPGRHPMRLGPGGLQVFLSAA